MRISSSPRRLADGRILWDGIQRDITENRRSENEARRQAMLLEAQLNASIEGVLVVDSDGNKILQNKRCIELWKIPAHIAENQDDRLQVDFVKNSIKDPEAFLRQIAHLYTHPNESSRDEVEFKDGTVLDRYSAPILGRDGTLIGRIWTFRDITQHKQTEARLRRYELLAHHSNDIVIFIRRNDGRILEANVAAQHAYGYSHEELLSLTVRDLRTLSVRGLAEEQMAEAESRGLRFETIHQRKDGTTFPAEVSSGGAIIDGTRTLVSVIRDITERKQAEEALRESESRFRQLAESLPQLVWTCQPDGACDYLNRQWIEFTGVPEARQHGFGWLEQLHPDDRAPTVAAWEAAVASGSDFRVEFRIRRHDGEYRWFDTQAVRLRDAAGRTVKWFGANTDMTER
jgi:PAS domain S-box-containing protein